MLLIGVRNSVLWNNSLRGATDVGRRFAATHAHVPPSAGPPKAVSGTSGCTDSGVRYYAARSVQASKSRVCFVIAEQLHQFAVMDGGGLSGAACATFCAQRLPRLVSRAFMERLHYSPLESATDPISGIRLTPAEAAAVAWSDSLAAGFAECDRVAVQEESLSEGHCGGLFCAVARSGAYIASVGLGRAVVGTEEDSGAALLCDEASNPHSSASAVEARRWADAAASQEEPRLPPPDAPTRRLGGAAAKRKESRLIALPDVVRQRHARGRRFVVLGSPGIWVQGSEQPLRIATEAYRRGQSPADAVLEQSEGDAAAVVLVLPGGLGGESCPLPDHGRLSRA